MAGLLVFVGYALVLGVACLYYFLLARGGRRW